MHLRAFLRTLRRPLCLVAVLGAAVLPADATWSIVVLDTSTGEVVVAAATCLSNYSLAGPLASVAVGKGGGACQSYIFHEGKSIIFQGLQAGKTPAEILSEIHLADSDPTIRQYGIVGLEGPPVTFTGVNCGSAALGVAGEVGSLRYAIQGNVLAGDAVVHVAEQTLLDAPGDLGQRVMAAMLAASAMGGDGRCSCSNTAPDSCGTPPPSFTHAALTAFILISRNGDVDSTTCGVTNNTCTNGNYYALLAKQGSMLSPEPVQAVARKLNIWRQALAGRADHFLTEVYSTSQVLKADGSDSTQVDVALVDVDGRPVTSSAQLLAVTALEDPGLLISPVVNNGDGTHRFSIVGGTNPGHARVKIVVRDGIRDVRLWPDLELTVVEPTPLFANRHTVSGHEATQVRFDLAVPARAGGPYHLLASSAGTSPGTPFGALTLPLNPSRLLRSTVLFPNSAMFTNSLGTLDGAGNASAWLNLAPGEFAQHVGGHIDLVAFLAGSPDRLTNVVGFDVVP